MKHVIPIKGILEGFRNPNQQRENLKKKSVLRIILYQDFHAHLVCHRFSPIFQREIHLLHPEIVGLRLRQGQAVRNLSPTIRQNWRWSNEAGVRRKQTVRRKMEDAVFMQNRNRTFGVFLYEYCIFFLWWVPTSCSKTSFWDRKFLKHGLETSQKKKTAGAVLHLWPSLLYSLDALLGKEASEGSASSHETKTKNGEHPPKVPPLSKSAVKMQS